MNKTLVFSASNMFYASKLWLVSTIAKLLPRKFTDFLYNLQQFSSSELSEQCCLPSHTWTLRIHAPVVVHLKSSAAKHVRLSANNKDNYISMMIILMLKKITTLYSYVLCTYEVAYTQCYILLRMCICECLCNNCPQQHIWYFKKYHFKTLKPLQFPCTVL